MYQFLYIKKMFSRELTTLHPSKEGQILDPQTTISTIIFLNCIIHSQFTLKRLS